MSISLWLSLFSVCDNHFEDSFYYKGTCVKSSPQDPAMVISLCILPDPLCQTFSMTVQMG